MCFCLLACWPTGSRAQPPVWVFPHTTDFARTLLDDADAEAARATLGLTIGTTVQAYDPDLTTWAGITPHASWQDILDGTSTTMANNGTIRSQLNAAPIYDNRDYANLAAAITAIGATVGELHIWDAETLTANTVFPATLGVVIHKGGSIVKASTYTLTINGPFEAGLYQCFSGFTTVTLAQAKQVYPQWFGATGDGVTDDTAAIRAAIYAAYGIVVTIPGGLPGSFSHSFGTGPVVYFPPGKYYLTDYLTADTDKSINYVTFKGDHAIFTTDANDFTVFGGVGFQVRFEGLEFREGATAINLKTANVGSTQIDIVDCKFICQTTASISTDATSSSTILNIERCNFFQRNTTPGFLGYFLTGDYIFVRNCWFTCYNAVAFYTNGASLFVSDCLGVPGGNLAAEGGAWFEQHDRILDITRFRMGGEASGAWSLVKTYNTTSTTSPNRLSIRDCHAYCQTYAVEFYGLPNIIELTGNYGFTSTGVKGLYVDPAIDQADCVLWQRYGSINVSDNWKWRLCTIADGNDPNQAVVGKVLLTALARAGQYSVSPRDRLSVATMRGSGGVTGYSSAIPAGYTVASASDAANVYGVVERTYTATVDLSARQLFHNTFLNYTQMDVNEVYTLLWQVTSDCNQPVQVGVYIAGVLCPMNYKVMGPQVIAIPFVYLNDTGSASTNLDRFDIACILYEAGDTFTSGRTTLVKGFANPTGSVLSLEGTTAPAAFTAEITPNTGYYRGDLCWNTSVAAGSTLGWVCTVAGNPGTWVDMVNSASGGFAVKNGSTSAGYVDLYEDSDNGTSHLTLLGPATLAADAQYTLCAPSAGYIKMDASGVWSIDTPAGAGDFLADGSVPMTAPLFINEVAGDSADQAGKGQIWVKNTTPNELWFTDDAGTAVQLGTSGAGDITAVWGDDTGDVSALTAAAGDTLDATNADSTVPWKVNATAAPTVEGQAIWDSDGNFLTVGDGAATQYFHNWTADQGATNIHAGNIPDLSGTYQPTDPNLTAIAGLTTAANKAVYWTGAGTASLYDLTAAGRALLDDAAASNQRTTLGLAIGTDVQAYDPNLQAIAGLTTAADQMTYWTGAGTAAQASLTAAGRALLDDAAASDQRTTLGLAIGTNVQAYDPNLTGLAAVNWANGNIVKSTGTGGFGAASAGTDYSAGTSALTTGILKSTTTSGALSIAEATDFPTLNQNTSGTAANVSGTPALPNGTTATTQSQADASTKLATTAYVDTGLGGKQATVTEGSLADAVVVSADIKDGTIVAADLAATANTAVVNFIIDGGGSAITTGIKGDFVIPFACTITGAAILGDQSGSIVIDLWQGTIAEQIAGTIVDADSITASDPPTVTGAIGVDDDTLTGWDTSVTVLQVLRVNVDSCSTMTRVTLVLKLTKT